MERTRITLKDLTKVSGIINETNIIELLSQLSNTCKPFQEQQFETLRIYLRENPCHKIWCVSNNDTDELIGMVTTILEPKIIHGFSYVVHIEDVVIGEKWRGYGFGKEVLEHIKQYSHSVHAYKIILNCSENVASFYEKSGFTQKNVEMSLYL